jgi:hypothetical protein
VLVANEMRASFRYVDSVRNMQGIHVRNVQGIHTGQAVAVGAVLTG